MDWELRARWRCEDTCGPRLRAVAGLDLGVFYSDWLVSASVRGSAEWDDHRHRISRMREASVVPPHPCQSPVIFRRNSRKAERSWKGGSSSILSPVTMNRTCGSHCLHCA